MEILTAPLQIGTHNRGVSAQFPAKEGPGNLTPKAISFFFAEFGAFFLGKTRRIHKTNRFLKTTDIFCEFSLFFQERDAPNSEKKHWPLFCEPGACESAFFCLPAPTPDSISSSFYDSGAFLNPPPPVANPGVAERAP